MTKHLDPRFAKVIALMNSTEHLSEKAAARARAEAIAVSCGMTFNEAMAVSNRPAVAPFVNIMDGFDDFMEKQEPGWKARDAAERSEKERQRLKRRTAIIERYGSEDAVLAPCDRERLLLAAVKAWRKACDRPYDRWTDNVDGFSTLFIDNLPDRVRKAIKGAYPLPTSFREAKAEYNYWVQRRQELEDVMGPDGYGDTGLDLIPEIRMEMVRDLAEKDLPVTTLTDLHARFAMYRSNENYNEEIEAAIFRDLEEMVRVKVELAASVTEGPHNVRTPSEHLSDPSMTDAQDRHDVPNPTCHPSASDQDVADILRADPSQSDRSVARACRCSPTTVGKIRRSIGLTAAVRSVQRRGQMYQMKFDVEPRA